MESMRRRIDMELVSDDRRVQKLINRTTFKHCTSYNENLCAVSLENKIIHFCKPIYIGTFLLLLFKFLFYNFFIFIGFAVLDISKTKMYDYHYNVMRKHFKNSIQLMYTDTGKLLFYFLFIYFFFSYIMYYIIIIIL